MLQIGREETDGRLTLTLTGDLEDTEVTKLENELQTLPTRVRELEWDLQGLRSVSTAGLRVLLTAQKQMNQQGRMMLTHLQEPVAKLIEKRGLEEIFTITE